jgi:putative two-component system response regulator
MQFQESILVVDDNANNREILNELLSDSYSITCAESGEEALRLAREIRPHLVLLDVMVPGLNGIQTCRLLREQPENREVKVVMLSARSELEDRLKGYDVGAVDYISKPFSDQEVLLKIRAWMQMVYKKQIDEIWRDANEMRRYAGPSIITLVELQHIESGEHLFRIRWYAQALAEQLTVTGPYRTQVDERFLRQLYRASPLHDIGKVSIDDAILRQRVPLTEGDLECLKKHTIFGCDILSHAAAEMPAADYLQMAIDIARHHHERFDGAGYPDGLAGEEIPLAARIVALVDTFDALTTEHPISVSQAIDIVEDNSGSQFDPMVVEAFRRRSDDFSQAYSRFQERAPVPVDSIGDHDVQHTDNGFDHVGYPQPDQRLGIH